MNMAPQPIVIHEYSLDMVGPLFLAFLAAAFFWRNVVPRQLRGLQVAFPTGSKTYEVHRVTTTFVNCLPEKEHDSASYRT